MINIKSYASGSAGNVYLISTQKTNIILECGVEKVVLNKMLNDNKISYTKINACFTSHLHQDHSFNIKLLQDYDIPCYCTYETATRYKLNTNENYIQLFDDMIYKINNDIQVLAFEVNHGNAECFGFVFVDKDSKILFITDFMECKKNLNIPFNKVFIECNYISTFLDFKRLKNENNEILLDKYTRQLNTHQSLDNCIEHLKKINLSKCDEINLIHISKDVGDFKIMKKNVEETFGIPTYVVLGNGGKI